jgi:putative oxidoreductase
MAQDAQMKFAWRIVSLLVGAVFVFAGVSKIVDFQPFQFLDPMAFARDIDNYKILPWAISVWLAFYLPWLEIICGLALIFRRLYSGALALVLALMVVFIGASMAAKARGIDIKCGCFGHVSDQLSFVWHLVLDFVILAGVVALWRWNGWNSRVAERASL